MFPYNYGIQDPNLFLFSDDIYTNPSSTNQDFSSPPLLNVFPSHVINFNNEAVFLQDFHDVFYQKNDDQEMETHEGASNTKMSKIAEDDDIYSNKNSNVKKKKLSCGGSSKLHDEQIRIKRRGKKDRHSKITTANGCSRGRRMRLSLDVAKEFFGLQDMLGFDKASKTVEWLLMKSENAIKEVTERRLSGMNHSPCPSTSVLPATDELESEAKTKEKTKEGTQNVGPSHPLTRGSREKARARARERTQKKKRLQLVDGFTDNVRFRVSDCSQRMNIGFDDPWLSWEKSAAVGNKFLSDPVPALEVEDILNYSKQQPHSFKGSTNTEELIIDHSFFPSNNIWNPYNIFNLDHNSGTTS